MRYQLPWPAVIKVCAVGLLHAHTVSAASAAATQLVTVCFMTLYCNVPPALAYYVWQRIRNHSFIHSFIHSLFCWPI